jgi:hypothetical protein
MIMLSWDVMRRRCLVLARSVACERSASQNARLPVTGGPRCDLAPVRVDQLITRQLTALFAAAHRLCPRADVAFFDLFGFRFRIVLARAVAHERSTSQNACGL